ncbi:aldehyde dehydrogenase family protein [Sphingobium sp. JS3065]|uniref:aldehyde dehydrogenase family protein n=1 Tax=Sphingobium sp. JS3065 TaxID=2970925 RepID=UPI002263B647|nr:aldehyde dehydrogenase family protein [Sphingobium sp. JS3065]UZW56406.1 aldehyde dehydrogenase family protein [Sphingobium sp. JS3065]
MIDGQLVNGCSTLDVVDPATGLPFEVCARADEAQLEEAIAAARRAYPEWSRRPYSDRRKCIGELAAQLERRKDEFARLLTREQGKPLLEAGYEVAGAVAILRWHAENELPLEIMHDREDGLFVEQRTPLGVVAAIAPWNFPLILIVGKIAAALNVGNTVVAKPAPTTPLTTALLGEIAAEALPPGVLNIIIDANDLGARLTSHPDIAKVSFTGSTATGKRVMESAASSLKRLTLELGGNDAAIILDDVDVKSIAPRILSAAMMNAGQICLAAKRVYAPASLYDELCTELARLADNMVVGNGLDPETNMGPIQNRQQFDRVREIIDDARQNGNVITGGEASTHGGYFITPAVVRDLSDEDRLVAEEQFGPVIPILRYETIDELISRVNDSKFGLGGTVWTGDPLRGIELAKHIRSGVVWVNRHLEMPFDIPVGAAKESGFGVSQGLDGLKEYTQLKIINAAKP